MRSSNLSRTLGLLVALLALGAVAIGVSVFQRQSEIEESHFLNSWAIYKGANELSQFIAALSIHSRDPGEVDASEVRMRLEILRSRIETLRAGATGEFVQSQPALAELLERFDRTVAAVKSDEIALEDDALIKDYIARLRPFAALMTLEASRYYGADTERSAAQWDALNRLKWQFWMIAMLLVAASALLVGNTFRQQRRIRVANDKLAAFAAQSAASAAEFQDAIASLSDGLILWDPQDRVSTWNARCEEILPYARRVLRNGISFAEYVQRSVAINHPRWSEEARAQRVAERIAQHGRRAGTGEFVTLDGRIIEVRENPTSAGGCISVFRDITAERRLLGQLTRNEAELQRALASEREINAQQRQFVSMASHEFKTPLAIIDGASQRLLAPGADLPKRVERIRAAVTRMVEIIDRTLSTAQLEEGRVELASQRCDLGDILTAVCDRQRVIAQRVVIALELPPDDLSLDADPRLLDQVFTNLVSNAVKYSGSAIDVAIAVQATPGTLTVSVRDHGLGIPEGELDRLFTRFYRASTTLKIPGTGIGLHLVKQFVSLHGGEVSVASEVSKGSTFTVRLPRRQPIARPSLAVA